jgi:hypothetical protein
MAEIIQFPAKLKPDVEECSASGEAICLGCKHQWVAVVPYNESLFECPSCGVFKGVFKYGYSPHLAWTCNCGNQLFYCTPDGNLCPNCGIYHEP